MLLAQDVLTNIQCSGGSRSFCEGDESLEGEEHGGRPLEVDQDHWRAFFKADRMNSCMRSCQRTQHWPFYGCWHLKQIGKVKKLDKWVPHELTKNQKNCRFEVSSFILYNNGPFFDWIVMCDKKWILLIYDTWKWPAQWSDRETPKYLPKPNLHQKRSWSLVVCCLSDPLQLSESQQNHYIWEVCSVNSWDASRTAEASTGQQKRTDSSPQQCLTVHHTTSTSKVKGIGLQNFASSTIFTWPLTNQLPLL